MAEVTNDDKGLFWNSQGGDRKYDAKSMEKWLKKFFTTGVFIGDCGVTAAGSNMNVTLDEGYANLNGKTILFDEEQEFTLAMADSLNPRIDTVVIERNDNTREIVAKIVTGTPAATPAPTAPVRTDSVYQLVVAQIYVAAGAATISQSNITDKRDDPAVCGVIQGTVNNFSYGTQELEWDSSELPTGTFYFQYEEV